MVRRPITNIARVLVLFGAFASVVSAGPFLDDPSEALESGLPPTYNAFLGLAGPSWILGSVAATFDSAMLYASEGTTPAADDPLAEPISAVPEPRAIALLSFGLAILFLLGLRRRRRSHSHNL